MPAMEPATHLRVVAAAVVRDGRLLLVSKRAAPDVFYLPGGKPEPGETLDAALRRELTEELGVGAGPLELLADVHAPAALEGVPMRMAVYLTDLDREPVAAAEIAALAWWPDGVARTLAPAVSGQVIPLLTQRGLL
jgi:8-oxo-dGTP diphosphatase